MFAATMEASVTATAVGSEKDNFFFWLVSFVYDSIASILSLVVTAHALSFVGPIFFSMR